MFILLPVSARCRESGAFLGLFAPNFCKIPGIWRILGLFAPAVYNSARMVAEVAEAEMVEPEYAPRPSASALPFFARTV